MNIYFFIPLFLSLCVSLFAHTESRQQPGHTEQQTITTPQAIYIPYVPNLKPTGSDTEKVNSFVGDLASFLKQVWFFTKNLNYAWKFIFFTWIISPTLSRLKGVGTVVDFPADRVRDFCALLMRTFARAASTRDVYKLDTSLSTTNEKLGNYNTITTTGFEDLKQILGTQGGEIGAIRTEQKTLDESLQKNIGSMQTAITNFNTELDDRKKMNEKFESKFPTLESTITGLQQFLDTLNLNITHLGKNVEQAKENRTLLEQKLDERQKAIQETLQLLHKELQAQKDQSDQIRTMLEKAIQEKLNPVFEGMKELTNTIKNEKS
jgi:uncharacterized protein YukE